MDIERTARFIASFEGFVAHVYRDPAGVETIGYGETDRSIVDRYRHSGISEAEAFELLKARAAGFATEVDRLITVPLDDDQHAALTSFAYNVGLGALAESTLRRELNAGHYDAVPGELGKWVLAGNQRLEGLVARRRAEAALFFGREGETPSTFPLCRLGDCGPDVERLQRLLVERFGYSIAVDGDFGPATAGCVREFQRRAGLTVDGVVGPDTWGALHARQEAGAAQG